MFMDLEITKSTESLGGTIRSLLCMETNLPKREWKEEGLES